MDGKELRERRKSLGLTQADFARRLGMHRDHVGRLERGDLPVSEQTAIAARALRRERVEGDLLTSDPMEQIIERALQRAGIRYETDHGGANPSRLDFRLPDHDVEIEVKRFHTDRIAEQMARAPNVIVAQGEAGVRLLARMIEGMA